MNHIQTIKQTIQYLIENVKGDTGNILSNPFFEGNNLNLDLDTLGEKSCLSPKEKKFIENHMEMKLRLLYTLMGSTINGNVNNFTFFPLQDIMNRYENYPNFYDVGLISVGMGHVICLSYSKKNNKYFFRCDGGSNGWEREGYHKYYNREE